MISSNAMMLQQDDCGYQTGTKNGSFIKVHHILRNLGIENNTFFLKLYNPELANIDPRDPELPRYIKAQVLEECMRNIWYYLREIVIIPVTGGYSRYKLHRGNLAMTWCFINNIDHYVELPRQNYKTTSAISNNLWAFNYGTINTSIMFISKDLGHANENLEDLKGIRSNLPHYLKFDKNFSEDGDKVKDSQNNVRSISNSRSNSILTFPSASSTAKAETIGRGCTQAIQMWDEYAFQRFNETIFSAAGPAYSTARNQAIENGTPYCRIITSTPGDLSSKEGVQAKAIINNAATFIEKLYDYDIDDVNNYIENNGVNNFVYIKFSYKQLGRSEEWFRDQCRILNQRRDKIRREILLEWGLGSGDNPFDPEALEKLERMKSSATETIIVNKYFALNVYDKSAYYEPCIYGIDVAGGLLRDSSTICIISSRTGEIVADFKNNKIGLKMFASVIFKIATRYFPNCVIAIERNNQGIGLIELLMDTPIENKLYKDDTKDTTTDKYNTNGFIENEVIRRKGYGLYTLNKNRELMFDILQEIVEKCTSKICSPILIDEIKSLVVNKSNKIVAGGDNAHDDMVMAYNIAQFILLYGKRLSNYGITRYKTDEQRKNELAKSGYYDSEYNDSDANLIDSLDDAETLLDYANRAGKKPKSFYDFDRKMERDTALMAEKMDKCDLNLATSDDIDYVLFEDLNDFDLKDEG